MYPEQWRELVALGQYGGIEAATERAEKLEKAKEVAEDTGEDVDMGEDEEYMIKQRTIHPYLGIDPRKYFNVDRKLRP